MMFGDGFDVLRVVDSVHAKEGSTAAVLVECDIRYGARDRKTVAIALLDDDGIRTHVVTVYANELLRAIKDAKDETP